MARIPPVPEEQQPIQVSPEIPSSTNMTTLLQTMAHRPAISRQATELLEVVMREGSVDIKLKELLAIRVSQVNHCYY